jgi:hypothetical protein
MPVRLFMSSGDLVADRRFGFARDLHLKGDLVAAADLLLQATDLAPGFASRGGCDENLTWASRWRSTGAPSFQRYIAATRCQLLLKSAEMADQCIAKERHNEHPSFEAPDVGNRDCRVSIRRNRCLRRG